ncbi:M20/M25/M40 family metallo-hydrolase [Paremcibacter congregatus]|uniref:Peptidase M20 dimerisation domain-containing protein n=1 Tax=Paremcibacter congregatus TaxID=2043170 RepID=A0A2G4YT36_9PROT|nr:M20/M25/M40 family metallo-hydrolase [Paremcibacter congregatus]PHZ85499.1 hypothetical protein CRD36_06525 [Paremcibacter congregatus]QDE26247.1 M20/M25/M40 family metallo-hydrolase [Paremcibacter congregatus]
MIKKTILSTVIALSMLMTPAIARCSDDRVPFADKALEIFRTAVSLRTAKGHGQVPKLAQYLAREFKAGGFAEEDIHLLPMGDTAALVVRYRGDGSSGKKPILLSAHMDVVEALPKDWERDPFTLIEEDGYFFGRGVSDDKQGVTALAISFLRLKAENFVPTRDLIIAFSGDEETGMGTTKTLIRDFRGLIDAEFVLVADAGGGDLAEDGSAKAYFLQVGEKIPVNYEMTVSNPGGHSSLPRKDNAIYDLADALKKIQAFKFPLQSNQLTRRSLKAASEFETGDIAKAMRRYAEDPYDPWAKDILSNASSHMSSYISTTCVATMLSAGHAANALAQSATATVNCRIFPGEAMDATLDALKKAIDNDTIQWRASHHSEAIAASPLRDDVSKALRKAVDTLYPGTKIIPFMAPYGTEGNRYREAGMPAYGIDGVFMGVNSFAHGENERIPVKGFYDNLQYWYVLLTELSG